MTGLVSTVSSLVAVIPAPPARGFDLGPLEIRFYSLAIICGIATGVYAVSRRMPNRRFLPEVASELAVPAVIGGFIGARFYHLLTDNNWGNWYRVWEGGLGIPGGIIGGLLAVVGFAKFKGYPLTPLFDIVAPALPLGQAVARPCNWFNQELFGGPLNAFWALEVDPEYRPAEFRDVETFHPAFLYESIWNFALFGFMIWLDRRKVLRPGRLIFVYMIGYAIVRLWLETIRVDPATEILGLRVNIWSMALVFAVGAVGVLWGGRRAAGEVDPWRLDEQASGDSDRSGKRSADEAKGDDDRKDRKRASVAAAAGAVADGEDDDLDEEFDEEE